MRMAALMAIAVLGASGAALAQVGTTPTEHKGRMSHHHMTTTHTTNPATTADPGTNPTTANPGMNPADAPPSTMTPDDTGATGTMTPGDAGSGDPAMSPGQVGNSF